ncbi:MAG: hypothetical protein RI560_00780 [Natronomonas sp.]|jgi:hypothetical protein|uniref:PLDc_N domain-containing protein n=1 Tax=Natronomonas salsuginis TaxID=2217661 RepID=A0A4U5JFB2_9EURY|nr:MULTISPECIES: hypothetical protein [Natronomonas]MDR9380195.1 hypothetical protein [Natronomonas sp.]MDR9430370.1 hypothetical protein [Natronomonas sp.]TKR28180.1 hypothetical protein DM868_03625 [Natronomonas salsuginis]
MEFSLVGPVVLIGIPLFWLCVMTGYAYVDAPTHGMSPRKWAAVSFFVPLFGFFAYLFEREARTESPNSTTFVGGFEIHESKADDIGLDGPTHSERDDVGDADDDAR